MKIPQHKTLAQTGKTGRDHKVGGRSTPQTFKRGGRTKREKSDNDEDDFKGGGRTKRGC